MDALVSSGQFNITAIQRKESKATFPAGVKTVKSDFSDASLEEAFKGQDAVVSTVGATGFAEQQKFVDAALRAGVKRFLPSELSTSSEDEAVISLLPLFGVKKSLIDYLKTKESAGLTWTGIATSGLLDWVSQISQNYQIFKILDILNVQPRVLLLASWSTIFRSIPLSSGILVIKSLLLSMRRS